MIPFSSEIANETCSRVKTEVALQEGDVQCSHNSCLMSERRTLFRKENPMTYEIERQNGPSPLKTKCLITILE